MIFDLIPSIICVLKRNGETAAIGFVVTDDRLVATCARGVEAAGAGPDDSVGIVQHYQR
jgi:hypothetical protein